MRAVSTVQILDAAELHLPLQWAFKDLRGNGAHVEVLLRRAKPEHESPLTDESDGGFATHLKGGFSDAHTLMSQWEQPMLAQEDAAWMRDATMALLKEMEQTMRHGRALLELFARKGKLEIYGPNTAFFAPQYISGNCTLKLHVASLKNGIIPHFFAHMMAQHLDYPFGPGERRFSTSRLFDLCFTAEKLIAPKGLAAQIDAQLTARGVYQTARNDIAERDHVNALLDGKSALIRSSYQRVLQRERFAAFVAAFYGAPRTPENALLLAHYKTLVDVDLLAHAQADHKDFPPKKRDEVTAAIHVPLMMIFNTAGRYEHTTRT